MRIEWKTPDEVRAVAEPLLEKWAHIIPRGVARLTVSFQEGDGDNYAKIHVQPEYRCAHIGICPMWLSQRAEDREVTLVHELHHIPLQAMVGLTSDIIQQYAPESSREFLHEQWRLAFEGAVQDLAEAAISGAGAND
jgi:hypothetical protein